MIKLYCLPSSLKHHLDSSCLPSLSKMNSLISLHTDSLNLSYGSIPFSNRTDKQSPMSFQGYHIITYLILSCSNYPLIPMHMSSHPVLCSLCSLELLHIADVAILARVKIFITAYMALIAALLLLALSSLSLTKALPPG